MTRPRKTRRIKSPYRPSPQALAFHESVARFRYLIWGVKGGKTEAGAKEFVRAVMGSPGELCWVVAPTYMHLQAAERAVLAEVEAIYEATGERVLRKWLRGSRREMLFAGGATAQLRSADWPDNLRGPNLKVVWVDEGAFVKTEAWHIIRSRVAATGGEIFVTTTPRGRNWLWMEAQKAGLPPEAPYGEFSSGERWVSHHPTWEFPWVPAEELDEIRGTHPREVFDQEYGAMFLSDSAQVFRNVQECLSRRPPPPARVEGAPEEPTSLGVDLAKHQDFSAVVVMRHNGDVLFADRWSRQPYEVQIVRVEGLVREWGATVVLDRSNVGTMFDEALRARGVAVHPVDMNAPETKRDLVQYLQSAFEQKRLSLPDPRTAWAPPGASALVDELQWYEYQLTRGGRLSYSAPRGLTDDLVIALALANWGRARGFAGGVAPAAVAMGRDEIAKLGPDPDEKHWRELKGAARAPRLKTGRFFPSGERMFQPGGGKLWR